MGQYMPIVWIGFVIFMLLCEGFTTQLVSIWFAVGALCAAVSSLIASSVLVQVIVFMVVRSLLQNRLWISIKKVIRR